jgi:hypothetical protein
MEENVINLDELLPSEAQQESTVRDITPPSEQTPSEDVSGEDEGDVDVDKNEPANEQTQVEENIPEGSAEQVGEEASNIPDEETPADAPTDNSAEPSEYKFKDDFIKKAVEYYETYGTLQPYLQATSVDYDSVSDLDIIKAEFEKQNSDLSERARTRLFEKELERYNLDSYDEDDAEVGKALLMRDANKLRTKLKEEQQQFIQTIQPAGQEQVQQVSPEEIEAQQAETRNAIQSGVGSVIKDNLIKLEANGEGINYQVADANKVVDYAIDSSKFLSTFAKDGSVDWNKWTQVVAFSENPTQFISELIKHGKSLGRKAMEAELKNVTPPTNSKDVIENSDYSNPFDNPVDFLKGMTVRK